MAYTQQEMKQFSHLPMYDQLVIMAESAEDGWGKSYYHVIPNLINKFGFKVGAEIGVAYGGHSDAILYNTPVTKLYSVDPYTLVHPNTDGYTLPSGEVFSQKEYEELYVFALRRLEIHHGTRSVFIRESSHAAFSMIREPLDFVFIDARHTYDDLYTDIHLWSQRVKPGGMIAGHDYGHPSYPGIKKAVNEYFNDVKVEDGFVWWTIKK